ncbi:MAG: VacB/RNase II family 3'-5' exoribonuclease [Candidatus Eisenbacteria bacterium]|uniref:exoribonuclease II n=1 Tax=Eiseniibacteriota bacterium TaxID=2212470 RepID=A0A849T397_UNCEI|nr:VacB/RNase II family 3'-5' exoribonuclease [Candidatus Eisenbacteria bacterium]
MRELRWPGRQPPDPGDFCVAELDEEGIYHLVELLGADDRPAWDDVAVVSQFRLPTRFPREVLDEASAFQEPDDAERQGREDLRDSWCATIDPEDARDHDDALSLTPIGRGRSEVGIHIADVSHYVRPDTALDREALARGTSCYLPGGVVPMLPEHLSSELCSLLPDRDRLAVSVFVTLDSKGELHGVRFAETVIRSRQRLDYGRVQAALDGKQPLTAEVQEPIEGLMELARALRRRRFANGALALEVPEVKAWVDEQGMPVRIERRPHLESHELIEEFMLLANRCVGVEGAARASGLLYRVHERPHERKLVDLDRMLKTLGLPRPARTDDPAQALQALLRVKLDPPHRRLLHRLVLRTLPRARYLERDLGHFGLATTQYAHFTSPIRRYPDLHNHRRVKEWVREQRSAAWDPHALERLADRCSATEQNATDAEREGVRVKSLRSLEGRLGEQASGIITGLIPQGFFVELEDAPVDGFVRPSQWLDDYFLLDPSGVRLVGRRTRRSFSLGDTVRVTVARVDVPARECDFALDAPMSRRRVRARRRHG